MKLQLTLLLLLVWLALPAQQMLLTGGGAGAENNSIGTVPTDIDNCVAWFSASDYDGDGLENEGNESTGIWVNKGGNGDNLVAYNSPVLTTLNGNNTVSLNGSTQYLKGSDKTKWKFLHDGTEHTVFVVAQAKDPGYVGFVYGTSFSSAHQGATLVFRENGGQRAIQYQVTRGVNATRSVLVVGSNGTWPLNETFYFRLEVAPANSTPSNRVVIHRNGTNLNVTNIDGSSPSTSNPTYDFTVGRSLTTTGDYYYEGFISELIFYDRPLTAQEIETLEAYLQTKYLL